MTTLDTREWLEADGLGGFASGTASGIRTRRYHGLLLTATHPPAGRMMLVNGVEAVLETPDGPVDLSTSRYAPDVIHPDGASRIERFDHDPWPIWRYRVSSTATVVHELFVTRDAPRVVLRWRLEGSLPSARLSIRPFLSGRDYHQLHHENAAFDFTARPGGTDVVEWTPYPGVPGVRSRSNGEYEHAPDWYRQVLYSEERARGLDDTEDVASPGRLLFDLTAGDAVWILEPTTTAASDESALAMASRLQLAELDRRSRYASPLHRSADQYLVRRDAGFTVVAGYPWFTDWGRDTFIAMRGLCLATGRSDVARDILLAWAPSVSEGMLPNRFPDAGDTPEFNAVDASLWFIVAVQELLDTAGARILDRRQRQVLLDAVDQVLRGYSGGTRYGIRADSDGLLAAGEPGVQLTWMDAKVGDDVVTPRIGKPVEVQALWLNALSFAGRRDRAWRTLFDKGTTSFTERFWNGARGCLYDVVDVDHVPGKVDAAIRPNQILAIGGLPLQLLKGPRARAVVDVVERTLLTPVGLRSLAPGEPGYVPRYEGGVWSRDHAYHQGTVWPWLLGGFAEAWARVHPNTPAAFEKACARFVTPVIAALETSGLGHLAEIADAEPPFTSRGCPFQAWSLGELLRVSTRNVEARPTSKGCVPMTVGTPAGSGAR